MIELFMNHPNALLYLWQIVEILWANDPCSDETTTEMYITFLNKKLYALRANIQIFATENDAYILEEAGRNQWPVR